MTSPRDIFAGPGWRFRRAIVALLIVAACASSALAQFLPWGPFEQPGPFTREAFASPYGRAMVAELGKALREGADPACLQSKNIAAEQLTARGEQLIVTWGTRAMEKQSSLLDAKAYDEAFARSAGPNATAELKRLRENADVKRYLAIERPARLAKVLDFVFEQFDRYVLINRLKLPPVFPLASGNAALLDQDPSEKIEEALEAFTKTKKKSAALQRFLALSGKSVEAMKASIKRDEAAQAGPRAFVGGVEADLAELCIGKR